MTLHNLLTGVITYVLMPMPEPLWSTQDSKSKHSVPTPPLSSVPFHLSRVKPHTHRDPASLPSCSHVAFQQLIPGTKSIVDWGTLNVSHYGLQALRHRGFHFLRSLPKYPLIKMRSTSFCSGYRESSNSWPRSSSDTLSSPVLWLDFLGPCGLHFPPCVVFLRMKEHSLKHLGVFINTSPGSQRVC